MFVLAVFLIMLLVLLGWTLVPAGKREDDRTAEHFRGMADLAEQQHELDDLRRQRREARELVARRKRGGW